MAVVNLEVSAARRLRNGAATSAGTSLQVQTYRTNYSCKSSPAEKYL